MARNHVLMLVSSSPRVGKTTLAESLAAVFALERVVRLVASDAGGNGSQTWASAARVTTSEERDPGRLAAFLGAPWEGLTIVDGPSAAEGGDAVLESSELVLVPASVDDLDVAGVKAILGACGRVKKRVLVVLSLVDPRATAALRRAREALTGIGAPLARNPFCRRTVYAEAAAAHVPITTHAPSSIAVSEVRALANEIAALLR